MQQRQCRSALPQCSVTAQYSPFIKNVTGCPCWIKESQTALRTTNSSWLHLFLSLPVWVTGSQCLDERERISCIPHRCQTSVFSLPFFFFFIVREPQLLALSPPLPSLAASRLQSRSLTHAQSHTHAHTHAHSLRGILRDGWKLQCARHFSVTFGALKICLYFSIYKIGFFFFVPPLLLW